MLTQPIHDAFLWQSKTCHAMGAPLSAEVLRLIAEDEDVSAEFARLLLSLEGRSTRDLVTEAHPLRALGALHFIVLTGRSPDLAACYANGGGEGLSAAVMNAARHHEDVIATFMASPPQTNEVRRALCLVGGFLTVAAETDLPLRCLEIGASAGLNLNWDRFGYAFGRHGRWGDGSSPVQLAGDWSGPAPPLTGVVQVVDRAACDQSPVDLSNDAASQRLLAYIWPDQPERIARAQAAIGLARTQGVRVEKADAADWTAIHAEPRLGVATVLYHSIFWQYPPQSTKAAIFANICKAGAAATSSAPFAWLRMEPDPDDSLITEVRLTLWPSGEERRLARVHPHGATVHWLSASDRGA